MKIVGKIKVLFFLPNFGTGGTEKIVLDLCMNIDKTVYEVEVCSFFPGEYDHVLNNIAIKKHNLVKESDHIGNFKVFKAVRFLLRILRLRNILSNNNIAILHTHHLGPLIHAFILFRIFKMNIQWIHTEHSVPDLQKDYRSLPFRITNPLRGPKILTGVSNSVTLFYLKEAKISKKKCFTIPNGISFKVFSKKYDCLKKREELGFLTQDTIIGSVGNLRKEKNHRNMLLAFLLISKNCPNFTLVICGDGECRNDLEALARNHGIENQVRFLGHRLDVPEIIATFDVYCLPSFYEGMPVSILEAWAAGKPVVATDVIGIRDLVTDQYNGILVPSNNPKKLAEGIINILQNGELRKKIQTNGQRLVLDLYSLESMVKKYEDLFQRLMKL